MWRSVRLRVKECNDSERATQIYYLCVYDEACLRVGGRAQSSKYTRLTSFERYLFTGKSTTGRCGLREIRNGNQDRSEER